MRSGVFFLVLLCIAFTNAVNYSVVLTFDGGLPFCSQCGAAGAYACSPFTNKPEVGNWNNGTQTFINPVPAGYSVDSISAVVLGSFGCSGGRAIFGIRLNGVIIDIHQASSTSTCACNTCDGGVEFSSTPNSFGEPLGNYNYNSENVLQLTVFSDVVCINQITLTIYATKVQEMFSVQVVPISFPTQSCQSCGYSNACWSTNSISSITVSIKDPLPKGSILLAASLVLYGGASSTSSANISAYLDDNLIGSSPTGWSAFPCDGRSVLTSSILYQNGWPSYNYEAMNTLYVSGPNTYAAIGLIELELFYYLPKDAPFSSINVA